ncbi:hypothetical protein [Flavobacterium lacisediminis]|uniref:TonB-dependent receptor plug domain-containing protein n=1 Tax=Flavobacterium lacisediminis TaxID=2989705 RepID=A0ABT3EKA1_9FLAO|nr:hypothetical protein [Flavobacterium lacisediminis]MCW1148975.1 hypothetical protein [Flavobacterium lacisediminis]
MKNKIIFFILILSCNFQLIAQTKVREIESELISGENIKPFIDSLNHKILNDTVKFDLKDLIHLDGYTKNLKPYSMLIIVNSKRSYSYRLDIIESNLVKEFADEILNYQNIESIRYIKKIDAPLLYGPMAKEGCIFITLKPKVKLNYKVGGLKYRKGKKRKGGDNFLQRKEGEIMIRT